MSFPNLALQTGGSLHSQATGEPDDGENVFESGIDLAGLDERFGVDFVNEWLVINAVALGDSVTGATFVSRDGNDLTISFIQGGEDEALVTAVWTHSSIR